MHIQTNPKFFTRQSLKKAAAIYFMAAIMGLFFVSSGFAGPDCHTYEPVPLDTEQVASTFLDSTAYDTLSRVHKYDELVWELEHIAKKSRGRITAGPLVNTYGTGILPVNRGLMRSIINTVPDTDGLQKNTIDNFGLTTQGREIMAARVGNKKKGRRVMIMAQQHGNEVTSTEAVLDFLNYLAFSKDKTAKKILDELDVLFVVRANPDGGEPDPEHCLMPDQITVNGTPYTIENGRDCGLHRFNVDPQAGMLTLVEGELFGAPHIGYDINRYYYTKLKPHDKGSAGPIYPYETQAMIYALKVFKPDFMLDLHNQNIKSRCGGAPADCTAGTEGILVDGTLQAGPIIISPEDPVLQMRAERLGAYLLGKLNKSGTFTRFAQVSSSLQTNSRTSVDAAMELGIVGHWLEVRCPSEIVKHSTIVGGNAATAGALGRPSIDDEFDRLAGFHETGIREYLVGIADGFGDARHGNGGFTTNPEWEAPNYDLFVLGCQYMYGVPYNPYVAYGYPDFRIYIGPIK